MDTPWFQEKPAIIWHNTGQKPEHYKEIMEKSHSRKWKQTPPLPLV